MKWFWNLCLCACVASTALAQSGAALEGRIEDSTGAAIMSATVSVRASDGSQEMTVTTDARGAFRLAIAGRNVHQPCRVKSCAIINALPSGS